jgi:putative ABC transport system substrate-binding protein
MHFHQWKRRQFITLLGGAAAAWPLAAWSQQARRLPRVGVMAPGRPEAAGTILPIRAVSALKSGLRDLGYIENRSIDLHIGWDEGQIERNATLAMEFVNAGVDVIVAGTTQATLAARKATRTIPIVAAAFGGGDPVDMGLAASLSRPGGNVTGVVLLTHLLSGKRLQLLKEAVPTISRVSLLWHDARLSFRREYELAARELRLRFDAHEVSRPETFETAFQAAKAAQADAIVVSQGAFFAVYAQRISELGLKFGLPTMSGETGFARLGGFMNYGPDIAEAWRYAATYVAKILKGANPGDLPMEQAVKFELAINLKTARALGVTIPPTLLALADEVIE